MRGASALAFRRCFASSTVGASIKQQRPTLSARQPFDGDDEEEEYYVEEPFDFEEAEKLQARPRSEYLSSVSLPDGLDEALRKHSLPALRKLKDAPEGEQLTVHHFAGLRLDLAYGASHRVLHEVRRRLPAASFSRALDFGAGLTPLSWALHTLWDDDDDVPAEVVAVEPNQRLRELGARLTLDGGLPVRWTGVMPKIEPEQSPFDLVCSAYALAPLTSAAQARAVSELWERLAPGGLMMMIEPATAEGFATILAARELLAAPLPGGGADAAAAAQIIAPCPHALECPLVPGEGKVLPWLRRERQPRSAVCHSTQRVHESSVRNYLSRKRRKGNERRQHTESFCYLVVRRPTPEETNAAAAAGAAREGWSRILRPPRKRRGHVLIDLCQPSGEAVSGFISQSKADPWHYRYARRSRQGDTWQGFDQVNLCGVGSARLEQGKPIGKKVGFGPHDDTRTQSDANVVNDDKGTASVMQADELIRSNDDVDDEEEYEYYYEDEGEDADTSKDARS